MICTVDGTAGIGKTALAVRWAHRVTNHFPDGQLYVDLRGFDLGGQVGSAAQALRGFLTALNVPADRIPDTVAEQAATLRSLLTGRRVLLVLDNARDAEHVRPLLPGAPGCAVVVTSRNQLTGLVALEGAHSMTLGLLTDGTAWDLLARRLGADRMAADVAAANEIIGCCAGLPLALAIVAARACAYPRFSLATFATELRHSGGRLDALSAGDPTADLRAVFSWSYRALAAPTARLFRWLSVHPGPDLSLPAVASIDGAPPATAQERLAELTRAHLVTQHSPGRYALHVLLRAYATELCHTIDAPADRTAARHRLFDHYLHTAHAVDRLLYAQRGDPATPPPPQPGVVLGDVSDPGQAAAWLTTERAVLLEVIEQAANSGLAGHACDLAHTLKFFLDYRGALVFLQENRVAESLAHAQCALDLYRRVDHRVGQADALNNIGWCHTLLGDFAQALSCCQQAVDLHCEIGDAHGQANAWDSLGHAHHHLGHHRQAVGCDQQALDLFRDLGDRRHEADTLCHLGETHRVAGDHEAAHLAWHRTLAILDELQHPDAERLRARLYEHQAAQHQQAGR